MLGGLAACIPGKTHRHFINPQSISRHLHCSICQQVFEDPVRMYCGHTFCYACIQKWAAYTKKCPLCKQMISKRKVQKDLLASQLVDDLRVKCSHEGCSWQGVHSVLKKHQRLCQKKKPRGKLEDQVKAVQISDQEQSNLQGFIQLPKDKSVNSIEN